VVPILRTIVKKPLEIYLILCILTAKKRYSKDEPTLTPVDLMLAFMIPNGMCYV
jgi:hypothetical protein